MREKGIGFKQVANGFLKCADPDRLQELANSLTPRDLVTCGQKWLAHLTPFFTAREREHAGCQHRLFFSQVEYCDNLIFRRRAALDSLGERLLDANRTIGQPDTITVIFGRKITKHYRGKLQTEIEDMSLPNPVIRSHYGNGFIKQYVRDHLILRTEAASNNVNDYGVKKAVENLPVLQKALSAINDNYLSVQQDILEPLSIAASCESSRNHRSPQQESAFRASSSITLGSSPSCMRLCASHTSRLAIPLRPAEIHPAVIEALGCTPVALHPRFAPLRPVETPRQGPCRQAPQLSPLSAPSSGILNLPRLPEAVRTCLRATHGRPSQSRQIRRPARRPKAIPA